MNKPSEKKYHFANYFQFNPKPCGELLLYQLDDVFCNSDTVIPSHIQYCYEFTYVIEGKGVMYSNNEKININKWDCFLSYIGERHEIISDPNEPLRYFCLAYGFNTENMLFKVHTTLTEQFKEPSCRIFNSPNFKSEFLKAFENLALNDDFTPKILEMVINTLVITYFRHVTKSSPNDYELYKSEKSYLAHKIVKYIDNNYLSIVSLRELEDIFNYKYQYLSRCFYAAIGKNMQKYFLALKMQKSAEMLLSTNLSVTQLAEYLNYSCIQSFSHAFLNYFKITPLEYRNRHKIEN